MRFDVRLLRASALLLVLAGVPAGVASAGPSGAADAGQSAPAASARRIRIDNFGRVDDHYFRGGQPSGQDYADLAELGVRTVINLTSDDAQPDEQTMVQRAGMRYIALPMTTRVAPTPALAARFLQVVNDPANQPVYVHCVGGRHRTGVMTALYRMTVGLWSAERAFAEMKQFGFGADFLHPEFKKFVFAYKPPLDGAAAGAQVSVR